MKIIYKKITKIQLNEALKIYNFYIENSLSNFEEKKISIQTFKSLYNNIISNKLPFIIAEKNNIVIGLAFVNKFREKSGYRFTFEHSIYVEPNFLKNGYGSFILKELIKHCKKNKKIKNLIAVIGGSDNVASIKLHHKSGFKHIGIIKKAGFKKNKWIDSVYMQKKL
tara:strand:- start:53 stop:553 length:501 start_codon:yes stop_codon:yes gene_type:complete